MLQPSSVASLSLCLLFMVCVPAQAPGPSGQGQMVLIAPFPGIFAAGKERERQHKVP